MKLSLFSYKFKNKIKFLAISLCLPAFLFFADSIPASASDFEERMEEMENRKSLPIQSNEIENWPAYRRRRPIGDRSGSQHRSYSLQQKYS